MPPAGFLRSLYFICTTSLSCLSWLCLLSLLYNTHNTNIQAPSGIRTRNPSKRSAADPLLRPLGHWNIPFLNCLQQIQNITCGHVIQVACVYSFPCFMSHFFLSEWCRSANLISVDLNSLECAKLELVPLLRRRPTSKVVSTSSLSKQFVS
jgi:hypothetical protein